MVQAELEEGEWLLHLFVESVRASMSMVVDGGEEEKEEGESEAGGALTEVTIGEEDEAE